MKLHFIIGLCTFALCVSGCSTKKQDLPKNHYVHNTVKYQKYLIERTPNTYSPAVCCDDPCGCSNTNNQEKNHATANNSSQSNVLETIIELFLLKGFKGLGKVRR